MSFRSKIKNFHISSINRNQTGWCYFIIGLLVTLIYLPTFSGGFILDDNSLIKNNPYIKKAHSITSYLTQEDGITDRRDVGSYHTGYYRPLINLSYWIDYKLWGMKAPGFRTTNLILHILCCFLLFHILTHFINDRQAAFWATLFFALHPVNTESVSWIISRNNILVTLFVLSSFYFYIIGWERVNYAAMIFSILSFVFAIFSKEFGLMVLPILFLYQRSLSKERRSIFQELISYFPFIFIFVFYFVLRKGATSSLLTPLDMGQLWSRVYFAPYLIASNLKLIFVPHNLHSFCFSYPSTLFDWHAIVSIALVFLMVTALWIIRNNKIILFSGLSLLVLIFPVLNIIPIVSISLIAMRWLYLPMAFISIGVAWIIQKSIVRWRMLITSLLLITIFYFGMYSYVLNKELWHDEGTFFNQEVVHFKNYLYAGGLAENLLDGKRYQEAERYFRIAINNYPHEAKNYINYSALLIETGRPNDALLYLKNAKALFMSHKERGEWFNNIGMAYFNLKKNDNALKSFKKAILFSPSESQFWANLGGAYGSIGAYRNSIAVLENGLALFPDSELLRKNLGVSYYHVGEYAKAISVLEKIPLESRQKDPGITRLIKEVHQKAKTGSHL